MHGLYKNYIDKPSCVILCVLPANADAATQQAAAWAHEADPEGERTLAVVTKIDKAEANDPTLADRLRGLGANAWRFPLGVVAMRNAAATATAGRADVDAAEAACFAAQPALAALPPAEAAATLGAAALVARLVAIQGAAVRAALPGATAAVRDALAADRRALAALPATVKSVADAAVAFAALSGAALAVVNDVLDARYEKLHAFAALRAPAGPAAPPAEALAQRFGALRTPAGCAAPPAAALALHVPPRLADAEAAFAAAARAALPPVMAPAFTAALTRALREARGVALPDGQSPGVLSALVEADVAALGPPAEALVDAAHALLARLADAVATEIFGAFPALAARARAALAELLADAAAAARDHIAEQLDLEAVPFTLDPAYGAALDRMASWAAARAEAAAAAPPKPGQVFVPAPWTDAALEAIVDGRPPAPGTFVAAACGAPAPAAPVALDADAVLATQKRLFAYRHVLVRRFVDQVAGYVRLRFPRALRARLVPTINAAVWEAPGPKAPPPLLALMAEPEALAAERRRLSERVKLLTKAAEELRRA